MELYEKTLTALDSANMVMILTLRWRNSEFQL